jgi:hypothetical protein
MADASSSLSPALVDRFAGAFAAFVKEAANAVADAGQNPELAAAPAFQAWCGKVLPLLQHENEELQMAMMQFRAGDARALLAAAEDKRGLAKDMDGFPLTFAGEKHAQALAELRTAVVRSACRICEAAGIP